MQRQSTLNRLDSQRQEFLVKIRRQSRATSLKQTRDLNLTSLTSRELLSLLGTFPESLTALETYIKQDLSCLETKLISKQISTALPQLYNKVTLQSRETYLSWSNILVFALIDCQKAREEFFKGPFLDMSRYAFIHQQYVNLLIILGNTDLRQLEECHFDSISKLVRNGLVAGSTYAAMLLIRIIETVDRPCNTGKEKIIDLFCRVFQYEIIRALMSMMMRRAKKQHPFLVLTVLVSLTGVKEEDLGRKYARVLVEEGILQKLRYFCEFGQAKERKRAWILVYNIYCDPLLRTLTNEFQFVQQASESITSVRQLEEVMNEQISLFLLYLAELETPDQFQRFQSNQGLKTVMFLLDSTHILGVRKLAHRVMILEGIKNLMDYGQNQQPGNPYLVYFREHRIQQHLVNLEGQQDEATFEVVKDLLLKMDSND